MKRRENERQGGIREARIGWEGRKRQEQQEDGDEGSREGNAGAGTLRVVVVRDWRGPMDLTLRSAATCVTLECYLASLSPKFHSH